MIAAGSSIDRRMEQMKQNTHCAHRASIKTIMRTNNISGRQILSIAALFLPAALFSLLLPQVASAGQHHEPTGNPPAPTVQTVQTGILQQTGSLRQDGTLTQTGVFQPRVYTTGGDAPTYGGSAPTTGGDAPTYGGSAPTTGGDAPTVGGNAPTTGGNITGSPITGNSSIRQTTWFFNPAIAQATPVAPGSVAFQSVVNRVDCTTGGNSFSLSLYFAAASWSNTHVEPGTVCRQWAEFAMRNDQLSTATGLIQTLPDELRIPYTLGVVNNLLGKLEIPVPRLPRFADGLVGVEVGASHR